MSSGLSPDRTYTFVVSAHWTAPNGQAVEREQRVHVQGGERRNVDFLIPPPPAPDIRLLKRRPLQRLLRGSIDKKSLYHSQAPR
jgi:hypothetical protein